MDRKSDHTVARSTVSRSISTTSISSAFSYWLNIHHCAYNIPHIIWHLSISCVISLPLVPSIRFFVEEYTPDIFLLPVHWISASAGLSPLFSNSVDLHSSRSIFYFIVVNYGIHPLHCCFIIRSYLGFCGAPFGLIKFRRFWLAYVLEMNILLSTCTSASIIYHIIEIIWRKYGVSIHSVFVLAAMICDHER